MASAAVAVNIAVAPMAKRESRAGVTVITATTCRTVTCAVALSCSNEARTVPVPLSTAVARPAASTVTTSGLSLVHVTVPLNAAPYWSVSVAVKDWVSPMDAKEAEAGEIEIATARGGSGSTGGGSPPQAASSPRVTRASHPERELAARPADINTMVQSPALGAMGYDSKWKTIVVYPLLSCGREQRGMSAIMGQVDVRSIRS